MHSPTLANDFSFRLTLAFAPFSQFFLAALDASPANPVFSHSCGLFFSLGALFDAPLVCFQQLADSFCKIPGVGVALQHLSALCAYPFCSCVSALSLPFFCRPFIFIRLQIPSRDAHRFATFSVFTHLQIPFSTTSLYSHLYKTPGCHPTSQLFCRSDEDRHPDRAQRRGTFSTRRSSFTPSEAEGHSPLSPTRVIVLTSKGDLLNVSE